MYLCEGASPADWLASVSSLLLKLPAELRNQIYDYVLGGRTIHIRGTKEHFCYGVFQITVCNRSEDYDYDSVTCATLPRDAIDNDRHASCHEPLDLGLLRTCSQIYREARLLPFAKNRFAVNCDDVMKIQNPGVYRDLLSPAASNYSRSGYPDCGTLLSEFLNSRLVPSQIRAIAWLIVEENWGRYPLRTPGYWFFAQRNLKHLRSIDMRIYGLVCKNHDLKRLIRKFTSDCGSNRRRSALLEQQERCPSVRVSLELYQTEGRIPLQAALVSVRSRLQLYWSRLAMQTDRERDAERSVHRERDAERSAHHIKHQAAVRRARGLRPL